jgi:hypothetical protein
MGKKLLSSSRQFSFTKHNYFRKLINDFAEGHFDKPKIAKKSINL